MNIHREMIEVFTRESAFESNRKTKALKNWNTYCAMITSIDPENSTTFRGNQIQEEMLKTPYYFLNQIQKHRTRESYANLRRRCHIMMELTSHSAHSVVNMIKKMETVYDQNTSILGK